MLSDHVKRCMVTSVYHDTEANLCAECRQSWPCDVEQLRAQLAAATIRQVTLEATLAPFADAEYIARRVERQIRGMEDERAIARLVLSERSPLVAAVARTIRAAMDWATQPIATRGVHYELELSADALRALAPWFEA